MYAVQRHNVIQVYKIYAEGDERPKMLFTWYSENKRYILLDTAMHMVKIIKIKKKVVMY